MSEPVNQFEVSVEGSSPRNVTGVMRASVISSATSFVFTLFLMPYILDHAGADIFGVWIAMVTVLAVANLADGGVRTEVARRVATANGRGERPAMRQAVHDGTTAMTAVTVLMVVVLLLIAPWVESVVIPHGIPSYSDSDLTLLLRALVVLLALQLVAGAHLAALRGIQRQDVEVLSLAAAIPVNALAVVVGLQLGWGIWSLLVAHAISLLVGVLGQWISLHRLFPGLPFRIGTPRLTHAHYLTVSGLALITQVSDVFDSQWDRLVLSHFVGPTAVASFYIGTSLALQAKVIAAIPLAPLMVAVAEHHSSPGRARQLQRRLMQGAAVLSGTVLGGVFVFGPAFISLWLGPHHHQTEQAARYFTIAVLINLMIAPAALQAYGEGKQKLAAIGAGANLVSNAALSLILTIRLGYMGAVYGSILGNICGAVVFTLITRPRLSYWLWPRVGALLVAITLSGGVLLLGWARPGSWWLFVLEVLAFAVVSLMVGARVEGVRLSEFRPVRRVT